MLGDLLAVAATGLLCAAWVLIQLWVGRRDPQAPGVEGQRCGRCDGSCRESCDAP
ncbi:MAG TPA: hypothetical protein VMT16_07330 [Thermoanaerobaculia bacterium]|nr:hypothetical protein [Thermoanaerobaculia bacterium]